MKREPKKIELEKSIENVDFKVVEKSGKVKKDVMDLLHEYPNHFVPGLFEESAEKDFDDSDIMLAYDEDVPIGCLMFNRTTKEFNWLAVKRNTKIQRSEVAKRLFESFYPSIEPGTKVIAFPNTEDASIPDKPTFSGENFEPARRIYRSMGWEMNEENRVENKYGQGGHVYRVEWTPNKKTK